MVFSHREAEALRRRGIEVHLFGLCLRYTPWQLVREVLRLRSAVREIGPDVIHAQFGKFNALLTAFAVPGVPLVITFRGTDINRNSNYTWLRSAVGLLASHLATLRAAALICVSREIAAKVAVRPRLLKVVPSGVDTHAFKPGDRAAARRELGWPETRPIVLFNAGSNPVVKNLPLASEVAEQVRRRLPELDFRVLDGSLDPARVPTAMAAADCLLVTSRSEGSPTIVQEAMACDLPVVSVPVGDVEERLAGVTQSRVVPANVGDLSNALFEILTERRRSDGSLRLGPCSLDRVAEAVELVYEQVVSDN